jgi:hypothetical protein
MRMRRGHLLQRGDRRLGSLFLQIAHDGVQEHDSADRNRFVRQRRVTLVQPEDGRNRRGDQQEDDQQVCELPEELLPRGNRPFDGQPIRTVALESRAHLAAGQSARGISRERRDDLGHALLVSGGHIGLATMMGRSRNK